MRIIRVFPRRTKATPTDELAFVGPPPFESLLPPADEVHISITFTWDLGQMGPLWTAWHKHYPVVKIGGPAVHNDPGDFEPGLYLKPGYVITTRGCPNRCRHCSVHEREGDLRELPIRNGWDVLDNNLLAASRAHIDAVIYMLSLQPNRARFTGGLEARRVEPWFAKEVKLLRPEIGFLAYDRPADHQAVTDAARLLLPCFSKRRLACYVLCGYEGDTIAEAGERCQFVADLGMMPFPMYYRPKDWHWLSHVPSDWQMWVRCHSRGVPDRPAAAETAPLFDS